MPARYALIALFAVVSANPFYSQNKANDPKTGKTSCLLIRNDEKLAEHLSTLGNYKGYAAVKLKDFRNGGPGLDTILMRVCQAIDPKILLFETCDLYDLSQTVTAGRLEELYLLKGCTFFENSLLHTFKNTPVKELHVRYGREGFNTDSIHLLPQLSLIEISSRKKFSRLNKSRSYTIYKEGIAHTVTLNYYGSLYRRKKKKYNPPFEPTRFIDNQEETLPKRRIQPVPYACVKQPIPGININDTLYNFEGGQAREFYYMSGSKIMLDKNAFVTGSGDAYTGAVALFYREFRNPVEILLSGIPMKNKVNGEEQLFKSGGMYEIQAFDPAGNELKTRSDTSVKVNFALTDTSEKFAFYSLNPDGSWTTKAEKVAQVPAASPQVNDIPRATRAIREYYEFLTSNRIVPDTTLFEPRFHDKDYLYIYRRNNAAKNKRDTLAYDFGPMEGRGMKGYLVVRFVKQTKNKEIIFKFVETNRRYSNTPDHLRYLTNRTYVYNGTMDKATFMSQYHRKVYAWDARCTESGGGLQIKIKTSAGYVDLPCEVAVLFQKQYKRYTKENHTLAERFKRIMGYEERYFNKVGRYSTIHNSLYGGAGVQRDLMAYKYSKKFQTPEELKMSFDDWKVYVKRVSPQSYVNTFQNDNAVGYALVKSDMGVKNIDCYLHSGEMENIFVQYNGVNLDSLPDQYHAVLYKSINTSQPLMNAYGGGTLRGYYFKRRPNCIIRLSQDGFMQVTRSKELLSLKKGDEITIAYQSQHFVKGMDSRAITRLILEE